MFKRSESGDSVNSKNNCSPHKNGLNDLSIQISNLRKCRDGLIPYSTESLRQVKQSILNPILPTSPGSEPRLARKRVKAEVESPNSPSPVKQEQKDNSSMVWKNCLSLSLLTNAFCLSLSFCFSLCLSPNRSVNLRLPLSASLGSFFGATHSSHSHDETSS
jgi:hypothetical protein